MKLIYKIHSILLVIALFALAGCNPASPPNGNRDQRRAGSPGATPTGAPAMGRS